MKTNYVIQIEQQVEESQLIHQNTEIFYMQPQLNEAILIDQSYPLRIFLQSKGSHLRSSDLVRKFSPRRLFGTYFG